jgi:hypothetical protein
VVKHPYNDHIYLPNGGQIVQNQHYVQIMKRRMFANINESSSLALWLTIQRKTPDFNRQIEAGVAHKDTAHPKSICKIPHWLSHYLR